MCLSLPSSYFQKSSHQTLCFKGSSKILFFSGCINISSNTDKTKYVLVHKVKCKDNPLLFHPDFINNNPQFIKKDSLKILGVMISENLTWKTHFEFVENKIPKEVGSLFKASCFLNSTPLRKIFFAAIYNHADIT